MSVRTLRQRLKKATLLDPSASERFDRLAQLALLAENVFEAHSAAEDWIATPNDSLGGESPFFSAEPSLEVAKLIGCFEPLSGAALSDAALREKPHRAGGARLGKN